MIKISILICTHNGEKYLDRVMRTAIEQTLPQDQYEIVVIDNRSSDRTKDIVEDFAKRYSNVRYVFEEKLGLCNARNAGIHNGRGEYLAFLDDDAFACPDWLRLIVNAFETQTPRPSAVGGKIILEWQGKRPDWLPEWALRMLTYIDYSPKGKFLDYTKYEYPFGANMAFRKDDILSVGCFNPAFDRKGTKLLSNGDKSLFLRLHEEGMKVYYEPDAYVHHLAHANRVTIDFLNRRQYWQGISDVLLFYAHSSTVKERARFSFYTKQLMEHLKKYEDKSLPLPQHVFHGYNVRYYWGALVQELKMTVKGGGLILALRRMLQQSVTNNLADVSNKNRSDSITTMNSIDNSKTSISDTARSHSTTGQLECPLCESKVDLFLPFGMKKTAPPRLNAQCPACKSLERHRLMWLYFRNRTNLFTAPHKMLHVAPELLLMDKLRNQPNIDYLSADLDSALAMVKMDLTDIQFDDNSFDVIYCSHVLEHIPDDRKAMSEMCRVLRPGGWAILQVPLWGPKTIEDPTITTPEERERAFHQFDHVRHYGNDGVYKQRLEEAGFTVKVDSFIQEFGEEGIKHYGLMRGEDIYYCTKNAGTVNPAKESLTKVSSQPVITPAQQQDVKGSAEIDYWKKRKEIEGVLTNAHYEYFYTTHYGLDHHYYTGKKIIDLGCGPRGSLEWASMTAERYGLDPLADLYRELGTDKHKMKYIASGSETMPFSDNYFDVVASFNSLDHVDDLDKTIAEIKRVIKPGGFFLLLTELNHEPTECEPITFSWDIKDKFTDSLALVEVRHFERSKSGMYDSIHANIPYDHSNPAKRYGILSAKFRK